MILPDYIKKEGSTIPKFAKVVGYTAQHLYDVIKKKTKPSKRFIDTVDKATEGQVKEVDFFDKEEIKKDLEESIQKFRNDSFKSENSILNELCKQQKIKENING